MNTPVVLMVAGALVWLAGELLAVFTGRAHTDTTSAWVWIFEGKTRLAGRGLVFVVLVDLIVHLVFGQRLFEPWRDAVANLPHART